MTSEPPLTLVSVTLVTVTPWSRYNEYEGEVEIAVDDRRLHCRVVLPSGEWHTVRPGDRVTATLWLQRSRDAVVVDAATPGLRHLGGVDYEAIGRVERVDGEWLRLDCGMHLDLDLDLTASLRQQLTVVPGAQLRVVGAMQLDLDPDLV